MNSNQASIYGFLLYTRSHSNIIKVITDKDYWDGLDYDSEGWIITIAKVNEGYRERSSFPPGVIGMMVEVYVEPEENKKLLELFEIDSTKDLLPCLVLFNVKEDTIVTKLTYAIKEQSVEQARNSMKEIITLVSKTIQKIRPEFRDSDAVMREVHSNIQYKLVWQKVSNAAQLLSFLRGLTNI